LISAGCCIFFNSGGYSVFRRKEVVLNLAMGLLMVFSNIELLLYMACLLTVTIMKGIYPLMLLFIALHSVSYLAVLIAASVYDKNTLSLQARSEFYRQNDSENLKGSLSPDQSMSGSRHEEINSKSEEKVGTHENHTQGRQYAMVTRGDFEDRLPERNSSCEIGNNKTAARRDSVSINFGQNSDARQKCPKQMSRSMKSMTSRNSGVSRRSSGSTFSKNSRTFLMKLSAKKSTLLPLEFTFESICSNIFWLRRDGRYATYGGIRFPLSPKKHNTLTLFSFEVLVWCIAIILQVATIVLCPFAPVAVILFYPFWLVVGAVLFLFKFLQFTCVWRVWYSVWKRIVNITSPLTTEDGEERARPISEIDSSGSQMSYDDAFKRQLNLKVSRNDEVEAALHCHLVTATCVSGFLLQSIPLLTLVVVNCHKSDEWAVASIVAVYASSVMLVAGPICFWVHYYSTSRNERSTFDFIGRDKERIKARNRNNKPAQEVEVVSVPDRSSSSRNVSSNQQSNDRDQTTPSTSEIFHSNVEQDDKRYSEIDRGFPIDFERECDEKSSMTDDTSPHAWQITTEEVAL
jgi:hypothetical protein